MKCPKCLLEMEVSRYFNDKQKVYHEVCPSCRIYYVYILISNTHLTTKDYQIFIESFKDSDFAEYFVYTFNYKDIFIKVKDAYSYFKMKAFW